MANKEQFEVEFEYTSAGAAKVSGDLDRLLDKVDDLARNNQVSEKAQDQLSGAIIRTQKGLQGTAKETGNASQATQAYGASIRGLSGDVNNAEQSIVALRYASYDIGRTMLGISAGITAAGVGVTAAFATQERAFADVIRTAEGGVGDLEASLKDLSTAIPISFNDLAKIGTLGNQLGVAGQDIESFTQTIATFSSATGIGFEAAAEAFGKLGNLLGVGAEDYDRLGSAIAYVGRTTAASESQIISIAKEIAPAAAAAGFAADEVVGLSGALGSLAVPPERSRSTILQFFETLNNSVAKGGQDLEDFAHVVGVTASELEGMVRSGQGESILSQFVDRAATADTVQLTQALQNLGLAGLRTNPTIRALAQNTELLHTSIAGGRNAWQENIELQRQMDIINQTLSASWQRFLNAAMNTAAVLGAQLAPAVKDILDALIPMLQGFSEFAQSDFGSSLIRIAATVAVAATAFLTLRGVIALATGSALAFKFALQQGIGLGAISGLQGLAGAFGLVRRSTNLASLEARAAAASYQYLTSTVGVSTAAATGLSRAVYGVAAALKAVGRATVIIGVLQYVSEWLFNTSQAAQDTGAAMVNLADLVVAAAQKIGSVFGSLGEGLMGIGASTLVAPLRDAGKSLSSWGKSIEKANNEISTGSERLGDFDSHIRDINTLIPEMEDNFNDVGGAVGGAAEEVRTLLDYASDLSQVWSRAFDIRFSGQETLDTVTSQFIKIREENERAAKAIRDLRNDIRGLNSDISIQEYYLSIAIEYGDTQRANAIEAELAKKRAELADKTAELQKEQDKSSKSLVGNTQSAIDNRKTILDLVKGYQSHIEALAASGMSQANLERETARLKAEFIQQATQLGYNQAELQKYARAFDDVTVALKNVPRNITVSANVNPALQALNELNAKTRSTIDGLRKSIGSGVNIPVTTTADVSGARRSLDAMIKALQPQYNNAVQSGNDNAASRLLKQIRNLEAALNSIGWAEGGYTGQGGKYQPAGVVHRGEYVIPKRDVNQATGMPYADALGRLMNGQRGYANGGYVRPAPQSSGSGVVSLSAGSIQQLAMLLPDVFMMNGQVMGQAVSSEYATSYSAGAN